MATTVPCAVNAPVEADVVYVLMTDRYRISRNIRAQWYLQTLVTPVRPFTKATLETCTNEIDIISIYKHGLKSFDAEKVLFKITPETKFIFFSRKYCFSFILDLSASVSNVDIQHSRVLTDELLVALSKCLRNLVQPFHVPGSTFLFIPEVYIAILAYNPFYANDVNNVILHGYKLCVDNIDELMIILQQRMYDFIKQLKKDIKILANRSKDRKYQPEYMCLVRADVSLVNMIRFGLLTLQLLPENSHQGIVMVTDGNLSFPDSNSLESILSQLRLNMISCSFLQIGSPPHPDSSFGYVPYIDFMKFFSTATFGTYVTISPDFVCDFTPNLYNEFHQHFLVWSFHYGLTGCSFELRNGDFHENIWIIKNPYFYSNNNDYPMKDQELIKRSHKRDITSATLAQILSYRLREGFAIKRINFKPAENNIELLLVLPWRHNVNIEYNLSGHLPLDYITSDEDELGRLTYEIIIEASYSFLVDITYAAHDSKNLNIAFSKISKSPYRLAMLEQFFATLDKFSESDELGMHFHNFARNEAFRCLPESITSGVPLFYLPPSDHRPVISVTNNEAHSKFGQYWEPICMLDLNMCQKSSLHTSQLNLLLKHDALLSEFLYQPNSTGRYENVQCNQAMSMLNVMLKEWSTFVLLENHSYVKLIVENQSSSYSFYLLRIISQPPCIVLHLAFIGGTSSCIRNQIVSDLQTKLKQCKLPQRNLSSSLMQTSVTSLSSSAPLPTSSEEKDISPNESTIDNSIIVPESSTSKLDKTNKESCKDSEQASNDDEEVNEKPFNNATTNTAVNNNSVNCFVLLNRPVERMLVRYEKIPNNFDTCYKYELDIAIKNGPSASLSMFQTVARFLCHKRFIWSTHHLPYTQRLSISSVSKILSVLTMKRLQEGFHFAYNDGGIVNMVMELEMIDEVGHISPCLLQYIIFPSNVYVKNNESVNRKEHSEVNSDCDEHLIVTECWVEPQHGKVTQQGNQLLRDLDYESVSKAFYRTDLDMISALLTYEHLFASTVYDPECPLCPEELYQPIACNRDDCQQSAGSGSGGTDGKGPTLSRFNYSPFHFDLLNILSKSQCALIKFSMLCQTFEPLPPPPPPSSAKSSEKPNGGEHLNGDKTKEQEQSQSEQLKAEQLVDELSLKTEQQQQQAKGGEQVSEESSQNGPLEGGHAGRKEQSKDEQKTNNYNDNSDAAAPEQEVEWYNDDKLGDYQSDIVNTILYSEFLLKMLRMHGKELEFTHKDTVKFLQQVNHRLINTGHDLFTGFEKLITDPMMKFKCFCKQISVNCLIVTILPQSYHVIRKLSLIDENDKPNLKLITDMCIERTESGLPYGSLVAPIFVYKITFQTLSDILLLKEEINELKANWNLLFDYSLSCSKFYSDIEPPTSHPVTGEIALDHFCKTIQALYWNIFTDAIYKSLRYGFVVDQRDVTLVLEKISNKNFHSLDITGFLYYACNHLKPFVTNNLAKYPDLNVSQLIEKIFSTDNQQAQEEADELFRRINTDHRHRGNCQTTSDLLKSNFIEHIQTHFSPIPFGPSNYYYFNWEAIQQKRYSLREPEIGLLESHKANVVKFYHALERGKIHLHEVVSRSCRHERQTGTEPPVEVPDQLVGDKEFWNCLHSKPFFVCFSYSFRVSQMNGHQFCKISTIPTCLLELFSLFSEEDKLQNYLPTKLFLNIEFITQSTEKSFLPNNGRRFSVSSADVDADAAALPVLAYEDEIRDTLDHFQLEKYYDFLDRINWLIQDEIVSISHSTTAISPAILQMVVEHICKTTNHKMKRPQEHCSVDRVALNFVVDDLQTEQDCIKEFKDMLRNVTFADFQIRQQSEYFFVIHRPVKENDQVMLFTARKNIDHYQRYLVFNEEYFCEPTEDAESVVEMPIEPDTSSSWSPNFWLIMTIGDSFIEEKEDKLRNCVNVFFHSRHNIYVYGRDICNKLKKTLESISKRINQKYLLKILFEQRICMPELISTEDKDPFNKVNIRNTLNATPITHLGYEVTPDLDYDRDDYPNHKSRPSRFAPGTFMCDIVWEKHFPLHPRLQSKNGINAILAVLNPFKINERQNLYVYREISGSVFYMRIYEIDCFKHCFAEKFNYSLSDTSAVIVEMNGNCYYDSIISAVESGTNVANSNAANVSMNAESDKDTDSITSVNVSKYNERPNQQCILLNVHGINEPSNEIKVQMVDALQKKMDDAVLDQLILMLARNPLSKFTPEDVSFIQSQNSQLENLFYTINENYMPYMANIKAYIRQNMSTFMYSPKYADTNNQTHFKLFLNDELHCIMDEDVFVMHYQEESGRDCKGIVCIILSIASREAISNEFPSSFTLSREDQTDFLIGNFSNITSCYLNERESDSSLMYLNFQIWSAGKVDLDSFKHQLVEAIRNSLWDFNLEFKIFKLCSHECRTTLATISEPSTPKKVFTDKRERRSGLSIIKDLKQNITHLDDPSKTLSSVARQNSIDNQNRLPQTATPMCLCNNAYTKESKESYFDFSNHDLNLDSSNTMAELKSSSMINQVLKPWLDFGKEMQVPCLKKYTFSVVLKSSVPTIIKELNSFIQSSPQFVSDMSIHFLRYTCQNYYKFDLNCADACYEECNNLMVLLRHEKLWNTRHLHSMMESEDDSFTKLYLRTKNENIKLLFAPIFTVYRSNIADGIEGAGAGGWTVTSIANETGNKTATNEADYKCLAPRQKFLLLFIEDRHLSLYLYNWSNNCCTSVLTFFSNLLIWHNCRSLLLQSLIMQKAGIFHNLPFKRNSFEDIVRMSNVKWKDIGMQNPTGQQPLSKDKLNSNESIFMNIDLLLKYTNPSDAINEHNKNVNNTSNANKLQDVIPKGNLIFELKNYSFIFSDFESTSAKTLFEYFSDQFNSNYNVYIRDLKDLNKVWQLHGSKMNHSNLERITSHVKKYGRLSHYCLTPFLFSHKWRFLISHIRDHTLPPKGLTNLNRNLSGGGPILQRTNEQTLGRGGGGGTKGRTRRQSEPGQTADYSQSRGKRISLDDRLDIAVCPHYIQEYVQYLQSLGFSSLKSQKYSTSSSKKTSFEMDKRGGGGGGKSTSTTVSEFGQRRSTVGEKSGDFERFYSIKTMLGGFFLFEIGFCEPYVYSYLYSFDFTRLSPWAKNESLATNMNMSFLDELDSIKVRMHLHSFTYDYHLRAIHSYISGRQLFFHQGYQLISFLDDFIKYYQKAPNYARNHIYSDYITFDTNRISPDELYRYIIENNKLYGLTVFPKSDNQKLNELTKEFALIHLSTHRVPYNDENNVSQEDNFDVALLISHQKSFRFIKDSSLCLKFFVLLTSQRELFPKLCSYGENKGAFRRVRKVSEVSSNNGTFTSPFGSSAQGGVTNKQPLVTRGTSIDGAQQITTMQPPSTPTYNGICDEKINYFGYYNAHEIAMLQILTEKVKETRQQLQNTFLTAEIDCRRDSLWSRLISSNGNTFSDITLEEFDELLLLVKSIRLDQYDHSLAQFYFFNWPWYKLLAQKLELKFECTHRTFGNENYFKMAFFKTNCKECFILFDLQHNKHPTVNFNIVFKYSPQAELDLTKCNPQYHELVEDFVNACTSHMWSVMFS